MTNKNVSATFIRALRQDSRDWWYHVSLRNSGDLLEARKREHKTATGLIANIRTARANKGLLLIGRGGTTFFVEPNMRIQGSHPHSIEAIAMAGIPVLDTRELPLATLMTMTLRLPLLNLGIAEDEKPFGGFSFVTPETYIAMHTAMGTKVTNNPNYELSEDAARYVEGVVKNVG